MSNGSEHMPERCVHAPVGPDWAGLREPSSWKERALAAEEDRDELRRALDDAIGVANKNKIALDSAEAERDALLAIEQRLTDHIVQLAAERDALQAENTRLRTNMGVMSKLNSALEDERDLARIERDRTEAERDALRTQLDAVREALTKDRVIMVTRYNGYTREDYSNPLVSVTAIEAALTEGAPDGQQ